MAKDIATLCVGMIVAVCLFGNHGPVAHYMQASLFDASAQARAVR